MYKVSINAMKQYRDLCRNYRECNDVSVLRYQIIKSVTLGQVMFIYNKNSYMIRYFDLELYMNNNKVYEVKRDNSYKLKEVHDVNKEQYEKYIPIKVSLIDKLLNKIYFGK